MNIIELAKAMSEGDTATSQTCGKVIMGYYGLLWVRDGFAQESVDCNMNVLLEEDWEIDLPYVDFWTAWCAARDESWAIKYEHSSCPYVYDNPVQLTKDMINGRWQILK